jgi:hypothetical protein
LVTLKTIGVDTGGATSAETELRIAFGTRDGLRIESFLGLGLEVGALAQRFDFVIAVDVFRSNDRQGTGRLLLGLGVCETI